MKVSAKNRTTGQQVVLVGYVSGGVPNVSPGHDTPFPSLEFAKAHLERNNWDFISIVT